VLSPLIIFQTAFGGDSFTPKKVPTASAYGYQGLARRQRTILLAAFAATCLVQAPSRFFPCFSLQKQPPKPSSSSELEGSRWRSLFGRS